MPRIVVKIGSSSLTSDEGGLHRDKVYFFANEIASLIDRGFQVLLVTSGAVAAGFREIGYATRPKLQHEKQASAAVGQALLMRTYQEAFAKRGLGAAQILLTRTDFNQRQRIQNAQMTIEELLKQRIVPIINENDTVSVDELKFGDNDTLSALVANLVKASGLIIITDTDGLYTADPRFNAEARRIDRVAHIDDYIMSIAGGSGSLVGTGGMRSKIDAARISMRGGVPAFVGRVLAEGDMLLAAEGHGKGTYFDTQSTALSTKKQWLGFHSTPRGKILIDHGAAHAMLEGGKSLLPVGVKEIKGDFHAGDVIEVHSLDGELLGRGIVNYSAAQIQQVAGLSTEAAMKQVDVTRMEVIHRDEWISLKV